MSYEKQESEQLDNIERKRESEEGELLGMENFDELFNKIPEEGIEGITNKRSYSKENLIEMINAVRRGEKDIRYITGKKGLRTIVKELLEKDPIKSELSKSESFDELFDKIPGELQGDGNEELVTYEKDELIRDIEAIRSGEKDLDSIPNTEGLKDTVKKLLDLEKDLK
ncbi:MAG: hypothetical protein HOC78_03465 [Candidatus Komeilibacteria bacterium]|jgi:hypothetical protein|nr:hypothetical protein [Candidatus Komeilibacteria bacterium]